MISYRQPYDETKTCLALNGKILRGIDTLSSELKQETHFERNQMPKRWNPSMSEDFPDLTPEEDLQNAADAWHIIWAHTHKVAPMPLSDDRTAVRYVLDLITKGAQNDA
jgi:hypothetical protein